MSWDDPLRSFRVSATHPAPRSEVSSELSSCLDDSDRWHDQINAAKEILRKYVPENAEDDTTGVLNAFLAKLPKAGQLALVAEIYHLGAHPSQLRQLRNFLVDAILKPHTLSPLFGCCS